MFLSRSLSSIFLFVPLSLSQAFHRAYLPDNVQPYESLEHYELTASRRELLRLKDRLGDKGILQLLQSDINSSTTDWHTILSNSTDNPIPATATVQAFVSPRVMNASIFLSWFGANTSDPHKDTGANPQHYMETPTTINNITSIRIVESWGDLVNDYTMPNYGPGTKQPYMAALADFPFQFVGQATLKDGTVVANVHNSFRDLSWADGIETVLTVWLPDGTPELIVQDVQWHQALEFTNWFKFAFRDIAEGKFP
jgi:hypothetical protein